MTYHTTVLLHEGVEALAIEPNGVYVDATFGGGGHSRRILDLLVDGKLLAFDQDSDAEQNKLDDERFILCKANFRYLKNFLTANHIDKVDGVLADFGVSGHQFDEAYRGFSFRFDAALDMRMNTSQSLSAKTVINEYDEAELKPVFWKYGEISYAAKLVKHIISERSEKPIDTISGLIQIVERLVPERKRKSELAKIFQAIRIEVNDEIGALKDFIQAAAECLKPGGRFVAISYHSLEDRPVKHFLRSGNFDDKQEKDLYGNVNRPLDPHGKVITPSPEEIELNPRARSARMRIGIKRSNG